MMAGARTVITYPPADRAGGGVTGWLAPLDGVERLGARIGEALCDRDATHALGVAGRDRVRR